MTILVTGAAGFIGFHVAAALLARGEQVVGFDSVNSYYDPALKEARLAQLAGRDGFTFIRGDVADAAAVAALMSGRPDIDRIVHLAAQAGVRYSLENPAAYVDANIMGQAVMLEAARRRQVRHFVYASSSSVYGGNTELPFAETQPVERPISVYAASKRSGELLAHTYSHLYALPSTGLRFFTVYGPWGRPDMAAYLFAEAILAGRPIAVFNDGRMSRDFTYIDDIVAGVLAALDRPPLAETPPHRLYNLGNNQPEQLMDFIGAIETALGRKAVYDFRPMQPGDVPATYADIERARAELGFEPLTPVSVGVVTFVKWLRDYKSAVRVLNTPDI